MAKTHKNSVYGSGPGNCSCCGVHYSRCRRRSFIGDPQSATNRTTIINIDSDSDSGGAKIPDWDSSKAYSTDEVVAVGDLNDKTIYRSLEDNNTTDPTVEPVWEYIADVSDVLEYDQNLEWSKGDLAKFDAGGLLVILKAINDNTGIEIPINDLSSWEIISVMATPEEWDINTVYDNYSGQLHTSVIHNNKYWRTFIESIGVEPINKSWEVLGVEPYSGGSGINLTNDNIFEFNGELERPTFVRIIRDNPDNELGVEFTDHDVRVGTIDGQSRLSVSNVSSFLNYKSAIIRFQDNSSVISHKGTSAESGFDLRATQYETSFSLADPDNIHAFKVNIFPHYLYGEISGTTFYKENNSFNESLKVASKTSILNNDDKVVEFGYGMLSSFTGTSGIFTDGRIYGSDAINENEFTTLGQLNDKQDSLISGTNIKTVIGESILGSGNIEVGVSDIDGLSTELSDRIPYTGADKPVDLNAQNLTNVGTFRAGITQTPPDVVEVAEKNRSYYLITHTDGLPVAKWETQSWAGSSFVVSNSIGFGNQALQNNTGNSSSGFGHQALQNNTGNSSNGFGYQVLRYNKGTNNNAFGHNVLNTNPGEVVRNYITAIGYNINWTAITKDYQTVFSGREIIGLDLTNARIDDAAGNALVTKDWVNSNAVKKSGDIMSGSLQLMPGTTTEPPFIIPSGELTTVPQEGALERDATGLYLTEGGDRKKISTDVVVKTVNSNVILDNSYHNSIIRVTNNITITIPGDLMSNFNCVIDVFGLFTVTFVVSAGASISSPWGTLLKNNSMCTLYKYDTTSYRLNGGLSTS